MLEMIAVLFLFQLIGETLVAAFGLPVPGPVIGMGLLFGALVIRGSTPEPLNVLAQGLLENLSFLFVPAGVGVMTHVAMLEQDWLPLAGALVGSTIITFVCTGWVMQGLMRRRASGSREVRS